VHEQQAELTLDEIQERFDWMMKFIETGKYDFSPPASMQRETRKVQVKMTRTANLTPHTANGRCRHAACGARGAPARRGGGRGRS
jgi:hypothetical protein